MRKSSGFTLIELMIAIAILSIITAVALPMYRGYVQTAREGALIASMTTMVVFEEDLLLRTGAYADGIWDLAAGDDSLFINVGWSPRSEDGTVYAVDLIGTTGYKVTATDSSGVMICREFPNKTNCP